MLSPAKSGGHGIFPHTRNCAAMTRTVSPAKNDEHRQKFAAVLTDQKTALLSVRSAETFLDILLNLDDFDIIQAKTGLCRRDVLNLEHIAA